MTGMSYQDVAAEADENNSSKSNLAQMVIFNGENDRTVLEAGTTNVEQVERRAEMQMQQFYNKWKKPNLSPSSSFERCLPGTPFDCRISPPRKKSKMVSSMSGESSMHTINSMNSLTDSERRGKTVPINTKVNHEEYGREQDDHRMTLENSRLKKQLHNLSFLHIRIKQKQLEANERKQSVQMVDTIERESQDHSKRIKDIKSDHDDKVKAIMTSLNTHKLECIAAVTEQAEKCVQAEERYHEVHQSLLNRQRILQYKINLIREQTRKQIKDDVSFYRQHVIDLRAKANAFNAESLSKHIAFVKDCMRKGKNKGSKSKRTITVEEKCSHDADVMSLVKIFRKDVTHLESIIDMLKGRILYDVRNINDDDEHVDVMTLDCSEKKISATFKDEYSIHERYEK